MLLLSCDFDRPEPVNRAILDRSLELGTQFMLNHQKPEGNFTYIYDWVEKTYDSGDSQVRQAGAMWGLATIYNDTPNPEVGAAVEKAMDFFAQNSKLTPDGHRYVTYPGEKVGRVGTVALCALAHIDYLRAAKSQITEEKFQNYRQLLEEYLEFLIRARIQTAPTKRDFGIKATVSLVDTRTERPLPTLMVNPFLH